MCEIQIIQKLGKEKINKLDIGEFFKMMCFGSMHNKDAFGVFNDKIMFKKKGSFDASKLSEHSLLESNFIIGHNRLATSWTKLNTYCYKKPKQKPISQNKSTRINALPSLGWGVSFLDNICNYLLPTQGFNTIEVDDSEGEVEKVVINDDNSKNRNHHPFKLGDFTLMHNGVISNARSLHDKYNFHTTISTDSYIILELIDYFFNKSKIKNRLKRITYAIQETCAEIEGGYSVLLYDKIEKNIFYFKNNYTAFSLCKYGDSVLCGSTSWSNLNYVYSGLKKTGIRIKNKRIYLITSDIKTPIVDVTLLPLKANSLYDILSSDMDYEMKSVRVGDFLKKAFGVIPLYDFTYNGHLKIGTNNFYGIREKINKIVKNPKKRWGWYIIKASDLKKEKVNKKKVKKKKLNKKIKLDKMKGGKK